MSEPWLDTCRAAVADVQRVLGELPTRAEREPVVRQGVGGDETTAVDDAVERAVIARIESRVDDYTLVSEEIGEVVKGNGRPWVVLDPIDGSLNAKRGIPHFCLSVAVADGPTMGDVSFGYVYDSAPARSGRRRAAAGRGSTASGSAACARRTASRSLRSRRP